MAHITVAAAFNEGILHRFKKQSSKIKFMNKLIKRFHHTAALRHIGALMLLAVGCLNTYAGDNKVEIKDFTVNPGGETTVEVNLENEDPVSSLQFDLYMSEGLEYVAGSIEKVTSRITRSSHSMMGVTRTDFYRLGFLSQAADKANSAVKGNSGAVMTIKVKAAPTFKGGSIVIKNVVGSNATVDEPVKLEMPDQTVKVSVKVAETALDATEIEVKAEETALLGVTLKNDVEVVGYQATVTLPEGLSLEQYEGEDVMYNDDRLSINVVANVKKQGESNSYIIMLSSLTNDVFEGNEGEIFALNLLAGKDFQGGEVKFTDIKIATKNGMSYDLEDELTATITVKPEFEDVTGDGIWNIDDVYDVLKVMAGTLENENADVNKDGNVNVDDLYTVLEKMNESANN